MLHNARVALSLFSNKMNMAIVNCVANTTNTLISLFYDNEDDDLLLSEPGLTHIVPRLLPKARMTTTATSTPNFNKRGATSTPSKQTAKKRKLVRQKSYAVISVCTSGRNANGVACRNHWHRKELKIVGVYTSKQAAESAKRGVMELYKRGHGDIIAEGGLDDEIDMFIREDIRFAIGPGST